MNVINQFESLFFEEYVAAHGVWNLAIENFRGDHSVPIMTIHKSKGLEYNAVYFIGLEDSAFWNFRNQPDEDRCTFLWRYHVQRRLLHLHFAKTIWHEVPYAKTQRD